MLYSLQYNTFSLNDMHLIIELDGVSCTCFLSINQIAMDQRNNLIEQLREHLSQSDMASANSFDSGVSDYAVDYYLSLNSMYNLFIIYCHVLSLVRHLVLVVLVSSCCESLR